MTVTASDAHGLSSSASVTIHVTSDPINAAAPAGQGRPFVPASVLDLGSCPAPASRAFSIAPPNLQIAVDVSWLRAAQHGGSLSLNVDCGLVPGGGHAGVAHLFLRGGDTIQAVAVVVDRPGPDPKPWLITGLAGLIVGALAGALRPKAPRWGLWPLPVPRWRKDQQA